jgi:hypothetical protein
LITELEEDIIASERCVGGTILRTRQLLVVFPLLLSVLAFSISLPAEFFLHSELLDTGVPEISKDYFPASTQFVLVASKSKTQISLWHARLCLQAFHKAHQPDPHFWSVKTVPPSVISWVALTTVMRC